jgi:hypothetical protein
MKYICPNKNECQAQDDIDCVHCEPHEHLGHSCDSGICTELNQYIACIKMDFIEEDEMIL